MTAREFDHAALADYTVVALISATQDHEWAAAQAWAVAREATRGKPRVALVDLSLARPALDAGATLPSGGAEGIVDALLYDASLTEVAQPQDEPGLHYLGVGTPTGNPPEVWAHPRWTRLHAGFKSQGALLLLFLPPAAIPHLALQPDGVIILARTGWSQEEQRHLGVSKWLEQGIPLLAVLSEPSTAPPAPTGGLRVAPRRRGKGNLTFAAALVVVVAVTAVWAVSRLSESPAAPRESSVPVTEPLVATPPPTPPPPVEPTSTDIVTPPSEPRRLDTLFYAIQVAAFNTSDRALEYAHSLEDRRLAAAVTPVRVRGRVWYRVILGALPTSAEARAALQRLWRDGLVASGEGAILRTPQAFDLGTRPNADMAWEETQRLRERGIPAYTVEAAPAAGAGAGAGAARILVGAFETPDQTAVVESLLTAAGLTTTLVNRTGNTP